MNCYHYSMETARGEAFWTSEWPQTNLGQSNMKGTPYTMHILQRALILDISILGCMVFHWLFIKFFLIFGILQIARKINGQYCPITRILAWLVKQFHRTALKLYLPQRCVLSKVLRSHDVLTIRPIVENLINCIPSLPDYNTVWVTTDRNWDD